MAVTLSHRLRCIYSLRRDDSPSRRSALSSRPYTFAFLRRTRNPDFSFTVIPNCSTQKTPVPTRDHPEPGPPVPGETFPSSGPFWDEWKSDELGWEILAIGLPALLALAADPLASLVDSAFVGHLGECLIHLEETYAARGIKNRVKKVGTIGGWLNCPGCILRFKRSPAQQDSASLVSVESLQVEDDNLGFASPGSVELAAVGISISVFNLVSKLFNVPLLNITTSFVAEEQVLLQQDRNDAIDAITGKKEGKKLLPAISTSLALAAGIGIAEAVALSVGSGSLMNVMGIPADSPLRSPAEQFLTLRAFGAPPLAVGLAAQGCFRGFMDTKTPLYAVGVGNFLNAALDTVLIFLCNIGIGGAAIATVVSEYVIAAILLWELNSKVVLIHSNIDVGGVPRYLKSGGLLIGRTIAVLITMTLATSMAARLGPIPMAGHQICLQIWLAVSLLNDALALAGQALLANVYAQGDYKQARRVIYKVLQIGIISGVALATILLIGFGPFSSLFSSDVAVLEIALSGVWFVAGSQPLNAIAFVFDGLYYGVSDFGYAAYSMMLAGFISSLFILVAAPSVGLAGIWLGLFLFMSLRAVAGFWRLSTRGGPWKVVWSEAETDSTDK